MKFFQKLFGNKGTLDREGMDEHLVRLHIPLADGDFGGCEEVDRWMELEDVLETSVQKAGVGTLDGNEIGGKEYTIWLYGPDGGRLAEVVRASALAYGLPEGSFLFVRHGGVEDADAREEKLHLA